MDIIFWSFKYFTHTGYISNKGITISGQGEGDDLLQCNNKPSTMTERGHQGPAAFLILASGLDKVHALI